MVCGCPGAFGGCAARPAGPPPRSAVEIVMAYDVGRPDAPLALPTASHESIVKFELPAGEHKLLRVRAQAAAAGRLEYTLYADTPLDAPGEILHKVGRDVGPTDVSDGKDGRWIVDDLGELPARTGVLWLGVRRVGGDATLWSCKGDSGRAFLRNTDPHNTMGLLPVQRTPVLHLEVAP